ncbi:MAG: sensor domain-containing diguanylate cyclase, partial [Nitrospirae bacterium]|nr:sensor domain-containing diguanylate cyclase [Nitrospirota bacterium]
YEDFLEFLRLAKENHIYDIPTENALNFTDEDFVKNTASYIDSTINYLLANFGMQQKLMEKIGRFTTLVNADILKKLAHSTDSMCRYMVDTIEFILSPVSVSMMMPDKQTSSFKTVYATGAYKDLLSALEFNTENPVIKQILSAHPPISPVVAEIDKSHSEAEVTSMYVFPVFFNNAIAGLIGVADGPLLREDVRIINSFKDYVELTHSNYMLRFSIDKKADDILTSIFDSSMSIAPLLNWDRLLQTIVEKGAQLLKAEQGSLMLVDEESTELHVEAKKSVAEIVKENMKSRKGEGIAGKVLESGEPLLVEDLESDPRISQKNKARYRTKSFLSIPLNIEDRVAGVLNISDKISGEVFNKEDLRLMQFFAANASVAIERSMLHKKAEELRELSITDPLTGVLNRRFLNNRLSEEISRYNRYKQPFSLLMVDVDGFKEYNDTFGHLVGDKVLKILASTIVSTLRNTDIASRFGGDEFIIIMPQTPKTDAIHIADRIKENVSKIFIPDLDESLLKDITVGIGLTTFPEDASSIAELLEKTDQAMYLAKKAGRNKLVYL